jgi:hypothetical protein
MRAGTADAPNVMIMQGRVSGMVRGGVTQVWQSRSCGFFDCVHRIGEKLRGRFPCICVAQLVPASCFSQQELVTDSGRGGRGWAD